MHSFGVCRASKSLVDIVNQSMIKLSLSLIRPINETRRCSSNVALSEIVNRISIKRLHIR